MLDGTDESCICWLEGGGDDDGADKVILSKSIMSCSLEVQTGAAGLTSANAFAGVEAVVSDANEVVELLLSIVVEPSLDPFIASLGVFECLQWGSQS